MVWQLSSNWTIIFGEEKKREETIQRSTLSFFALLDLATAWAISICLPFCLFKTTTVRKKKTVSADHKLSRINAARHRQASSAVQHMSGGDFGAVGIHIRVGDQLQVSRVIIGVFPSRTESPRGRQDTKGWQRHSRGFEQRIGEPFTTASGSTDATKLAWAPSRRLFTEMLCGACGTMSGVCDSKFNPRVLRPTSRLHWVPCHTAPPAVNLRRCCHSRGCRSRRSVPSEWWKRPQAQISQRCGGPL